MKLILLALIFLILSGCVAETKIDMPLTDQESFFYNGLKQEKLLVIDSIARGISKKRYDDYSYTYSLEIYTPEDYYLRKDSIIKQQVDKIVSFAAQESFEGIKVKTIIISYHYYLGGEFGYIAEIRNDGKITFTLEP